MSKIVKMNKEYDILTIELSKSELVDLMDSVECMTETGTTKIIGEYTIDRRRSSQVR